MKVTGKAISRIFCIKFRLHPFWLNSPIALHLLLSSWRIKQQWYLSILRCKTWLLRNKEFSLGLEKGTLITSRVSNIRVCKKIGSWEENAWKEVWVVNEEIIFEIDFVVNFLNCFPSIRICTIILYWLWRRIFLQPVYVLEEEIKKFGHLGYVAYCRLTFSESNIDIQWYLFETLQLIISYSWYVANECIHYVYIINISK